MIRLVSISENGIFEIKKPGADAVEKKGIWKVVDGKIEIISGNAKSTRKLVSKDYFFDEGKKRLKALYLDDGSGGEWSLGPITDDCEQ